MSYYKTTNPEIIQAFRSLLESRIKYNQAVRSLAKEVGAEEVALRPGSGEVIGFIFSKHPGKAWSKRAFSDTAYWARKNTTEGKLLREKLRSLPSMLGPEEYIKAIGYVSQLSGRAFLESPQSFGYDGAVYFKLPDNVSYTPVAGVEEIVGSVYNKAYKELNKEN